ncbi:hypothetical protein, partial [Klebsiella pneumoniae]|uniref:hypothetical protein n=1 Tax=Klebsiella pneumoniae TaxID=573 RepID=UPI0039C25DA8
RKAQLAVWGGGAEKAGHTAYRELSISAGLSSRNGRCSVVTVRDPLPAPRAGSHGHGFLR